MIDREEVIRGLECCLGDTRSDLPNLCTICPYARGSYATQNCSKQLREDALALLKAQEPHYPMCECCGRQIDHIKISVFNYDESDSEHLLPISDYDEMTGCVMFTTNQNWTSYELTDEERKEDIRCPHCGEYPFDKSVEIEFYEPVNVLMWTSRPTDEQREAVKWE